MELPKRKLPRLKGYDYSARGMYFVTVPTNSLVARFVGTFKRFCNKEYGENIWQRSYHDHIIRGERGYHKIWEYIDTNIQKWENDCFYTEKGL